MAEAIRGVDAEVYNDIEPWDVYEGYAEAALAAYEKAASTPREPHHFVEGVVYL
ncbi:hypothetical protein HUO13_11935 [Saccharopolyspora erythraea]|uniref:hypothetical protein n=1 Tax=Saccharopolyspora erythraea TaxID=1836 RepID=UPI001BABCEB5|nr:hypothetical protein [Saccharopolyspora erythraea]QUH01425.1 hypothetical protein HUO13_11935 [Saccharopolyspora erythraea]